VRTVELGRFRGVLHEGDPGRVVILLPGARYPTRAPLLWFAREVARQRGWSALEVLDELPLGSPPFEWGLEVAERALEFSASDAGAGGRSGPVAVVGKSLTSVAAGRVAEADAPAVWLTPLLGQPPVVEGLGRTAQPTLLVGGAADETWIPSAIPANPVLQTLELEGLDHSLQRDGDLEASFDALYAVTAAVGDFLDGLS
jgi:hypothetical protein